MVSVKIIATLRAQQPYFAIVNASRLITTLVTKALYDISNINLTDIFVLQQPECKVKVSYNYHSHGFGIAHRRKGTC